VPNPNNKHLALADFYWACTYTHVLY
jgi:hypothetical protein